MQGSTDLDNIQIIKKVGGKLTDSYLDEGKSVYSGRFLRPCLTGLTPTTGFILDKKIGTNSPKRLENAKILIANTCEISTGLF